MLKAMGVVAVGHLALFPLTAWSQVPPPEETPTATPVETPTEEAADGPADGPVEEPADGPDDEAVNALYDQAFRAVLDGKHAEALRLFAEVSAKSKDGVQISVAQEMIRFLGERAGTAPPVDLSDTTPRDTSTPYDAASLPSDVRRARVGMVSAWTTVGLFGYSWMVPAATQQDGTAGVGLGMLTAGASFLAPYLLTRNQEITYGEALLSSHGLFAGISHGALFAQLVEVDFETMAGFMFLASVGEGLGGFAFARSRYVDSGEAHLLATGDYAGILAGLGIGFGFGLHENGNEQYIYGLALLGGAGGLTAAHFLTPHRSYTWGDVRALRTAGLLGLAVASVPIVWLEQPDDKAIAWILLTGGAAGLVFGDQLLLDDDFTAGQGVLLELGTVAGAATGLGVAFLVAGDNDNFPELALTISASGALAAYLVGYRSVRRWEGDGPRAQLLPVISPEFKGLAIQGTF